MGVRYIALPGVPITPRDSLMPKYKDITGKSIGGVTGLRCIGKDKHNHHLWQGKCQLCTKLVTRSLGEWKRFERLKATTACGCIRKQGLVGQKIGMITVTRKLPPRKNPGGKFTYMYEGVCECGTVVKRNQSNMKKSQACRNCLAKGYTIDLTGKTFGRLAVLWRDGSDKHGRAIWICECSCKEINPNRVPVTSRELLKRDTQSCGCWHDESASIRAVERIRNSVYAEWNCPFYRGRRKDWNMKRTWEVMFGRYLDAKGWDWEYEPQSFTLPSRKRYIPDFLVRCRYGEIFFDVKGWKKPEAMKKIREFSRLHRIYGIDRDELIRLTGFRPEDFKKLYDQQHRWAYRGLGEPLWYSRLIPIGMK